MFESITIEMADHPQAVLDAMDIKREDIARFERRANLLKLGIILLAAATVVLALIVYRASDSSGTAFVSAIVPLIALFILYRQYSNRPGDVKKHFEDAYYLLWTLRDDTGRKGWVVGTLDLSGVKQKSKLVRTARSGGGKRKEYYRDPWFKAHFKLADGNKLRLTIMDKVKVKAGSEVRRDTLAKIKLVVNQDVYLPDDSSGGDPGIIERQASISPKNVGIPGLLQGLKAAYQRLTPKGASAVAGSTI